MVPSCSMEGNRASANNKRVAALKDISWSTKVRAAANSVVIVHVIANITPKAVAKILLEKVTIRPSCWLG